jgi:hypothetical protein
MSYLNALRLHFAGQFQASVSTVNNDPVHYDNTLFREEDQERGKGGTKGWWNPRGDGAWRLIGCRITSAYMPDGSAASSSDPILTYLIADSDRKTTAKLVDLDPQQQLISAIWGLEVRICDSQGTSLLCGKYEPVGFIDIWGRNAKLGGSMGASAMYQSVLTDLEWGDSSLSSFLQALRGAAGDGALSIKFNVDSYSTNYNDAASFTYGRIVGTIGPARATEPKHFVCGRQLIATCDSNAGFFQPTGNINFCVAVVDEQRRKIYLDLGNALPSQGPDSQPMDLGDLTLGYIGNQGLQPIDTLASATYTGANWYEQTAGVVEFPAHTSLTPDQLKQIGSSQLILQGPDTSGTSIAESASGLYVRADQLTFRLNPGEQAPVKLYATQFGQPYANAQVFSFLDSSQLQQSEGTSIDIQYPPPPVATPPDAIAFPALMTTDAQGIVEMAITASAPGNPRGYIDGQIYGVRSVLVDTLAPFGNIFTMFNPNNYISLLVWDAFHPTEPPTWWGTSDQDSLQYVFEQYANLYPVMQDFLNLKDYESVCENLYLLQLAFGLDVSDPNSMPATRDLSTAKRQTILRWMNNLGLDGMPLLGMPREATKREAPPASVPAGAAAPPQDDQFDGSKGSALQSRIGNRRSGH